MAIAYEVPKADDVYPLHFLDQLKLNRLPVHWLLHFDDVLDAQKLHDALLRLLHIGDWRKLGGRLRSKGKDELEIHAPPRWSSYRPAFSYFHEAKDMALSEHHVAGHLGDSIGGPSTQPLPKDLKSLMLPPGSPTKFKQWLERDVPLLGIRITSFTDATLVGISWPHSLMDASGARALLLAWSHVVAGRENQVPPVFGSFEDVLSEALHERQDSEKHDILALDSWQLRGCKKLEFMLRFMGRAIFDDHPEVRRIYIPEAAVARLKAQVKCEIEQDAEKGIFVSENCILTAWLARIVASSSKARPLTLLSPMNARFRVQQVRKDGVYLQNMILPSYTFVPCDIAKDNAGDIALEQQHQLEERATGPQTLAMLERFQYLYHAGKNPILSLLVGEKNAGLLVFNNLTKIGVWQATDFSAAVVGDREKKQSNHSGTPTGFVPHTEPEKLSSFVCITGKDHAKDYWMIASLKPKEWARVDIELKRLL